MFDEEIPASQVEADSFPFPNQGHITLAVRNKNYALPAWLQGILTPAPGGLPNPALRKNAYGASFF